MAERGYREQRAARNMLRSILADAVIENAMKIAPRQPVVTGEARHAEEARNVRNGHRSRESRRRRRRYE